MTTCNVDPEAEKGHLGPNPGKFKQGRLLSYRALYQRQFPGFDDEPPLYKNIIGEAG